jgi:hypothetical protein
MKSYATMDTASYVFEETAPERRLIAASLLAGLREANGRRVNRNDTAYINRQAELWLASDEEGPWSFLWHCDELDLDPDIIRDRMRAGVEIPDWGGYAAKTDKRYPGSQPGKKMGRPRIEACV